MPLASSTPAREDDHRPRPGRRVVGALTAAGSLVVAVLVLLPDRLGLDRWLPFTALAALRPALTAAAALLVLVVVLVGPLRRRLAVPVAAPVLVVAVVAAAIVVPRGMAGAPPPPGGVDLTVLTLNVYEGRADPVALAALIARSRPDVVVLPEAAERFRERIAPLVPGYRSWTNAPPEARDVRGVVVLTAPRAGDVVARRLDGDTRYPWAELTGGVLGPTRMLAAHLVSVVPEWISYWPGEVAMLRRWCGGGGPALVVGDLNATPDHSTFRRATTGCRDAATDRGAGLVATWRSTWPRWAGAQIDHVLTTGGPQARDVEVLDVPNSDHRALLVRLRL